MSYRVMRDESGRALYRGKLLPDGPWHQEPDHLDFRSPEDVPCILHRNNMGAWCGYVAVAPGHPWHGKDYGDVGPEVHGGLTYSERCAGEICHVPQSGESDDVWWLGFDCIHSGDLSLHDVAEGRVEYHNGYWLTSYKTIAYVQAETLKLASQAAEAGKT